MRWVYLSVAVLLLALWVPVTAHCALENLPGLQFLSCCDHDEAVPHQDDDCETDACAVVESGFYKIEEDGVVLPEFEFAAVPVRPYLPRISVVQTHASPPAKALVWSFASRATPPVRAPSAA